MLITYLRSSSIGTYSMCEQKYFMNYVLGIKDKDNAKALMGSVVHKNLELLARYKLAQQNSETFVYDDNFGKMRPSEFKKLEKLNERSLKFYEESFPGIMPSNAKKITLEWTKAAITNLECSMDPRNQNIFAVEEFFEIEIPHEWAKYKYEIGGKVIEGQLGIKGTVDLIVKEDDLYLHVIDYKSGRRYNWATETVKEYDDLQSDKQLLLYYYALRTKYPDKRFYISIYYINDHKIDDVLVEGGVFSFAFDDDDFKKAEELLKKEFEQIKKNNRPRLYSQKNTHWKCKYLCRYSQIIPEISTTVPACIFIKDEIEKKGIDKVTEEYADFDKLTKYTGGGRIDVEIKE